MRFICIGAHPDDCEIQFGGTAAKLADAGHAVKFVSMTCGDAGHFRLSGAALAAIRRTEAEAAARALGIACTEILSHHDGALLPTLEARFEMVRLIREWRADVVLSHRPWDYHPDHRYTAQLVQDSAYLVVVPAICPETEPLRRNPVFLYLEDRFQFPARFTPDIGVAIDDVWERKIDGLDAHASQFYEWLPWVDGALEQVPLGVNARREWLAARWGAEPDFCTRAVLGRRYGSAQVRRAEAFQVCEYGRRPSSDELEGMLPR